MSLRLLQMLLIIGSLIYLTNCSQDSRPTKRIEGDLYFSFFRIGNFYNQPDSVIQKVKLYIDTANRKLLDSSDLLDLARYDLLKKENLLFRPFIDLRLDNDSIIKVYLTNGEYEKIKIFKRQDLLDSKKKVRLILDVQNLGLGMALATKVISADKIDGQTSRFDKKLLIEDYR